MKIRRIFFTVMPIAILAGGFFALSQQAREATVLETMPTRQPLSLVQKNKPVTLTFVGDIMVSRTVANKINANGDPTFPFTHVTDFLAETDVTFANFENPVSERGRNVGSIYSFRAEPKTIQGLQAAGFDVVSLANNHIWDWSAEALIDSVRLLREAGIVPIGAGRDYAEANSVYVQEKNGLRIGWYAYTNLLPASLNAKAAGPGLSQFDEELILERIKKDKTEQRLDVVIVSMHWGEEYVQRANGEQRRIAHSFIDGGADIIVGHHPHVAQEVEWYKGKLIMYSLGNFVFDQNFSEETMRGLVVRVTITEEGMSVEKYTSYLNMDFQVERIEPRE